MPRKIIAAASLEFPKAMANSRKPMHMAGWINKLDDFLKLGGHPLLDGAGGISADQGKAHVEAEHDRSQARDVNAPSPAERHFVGVLGKVKALAEGKSKTGKRGAA